MTQAILLVACVALAGAVVGLGVALRRVTRRLDALERGERGRSAGFETGASAPSSTSGRAPSSTSGRAPSSTSGRAPSSTSGSAPTSTSGHEEYVITRVGTHDVDEVGQALEPPDARLFADLVLRESVVKAASFAYGVRRGLSPANRNRIWFEMRREVKRARKDRKAEKRQAIREWRARQRAAVRDRAREDDAA